MTNTPNQITRQKWSINLQLLWKILVYPHASQNPNVSEDIFGPTLAKATQSNSGMPQANSMAEPDFALIGSAGISGHKTVAPECVTYPPEQTEHSGVPPMPTSMQEPSTRPAEDTYFNSPADTLLLQLQDYDRAFEDWLSLNTA